MGQWWLSRITQQGRRGDITSRGRSQRFRLLACGPAAALMRAGLERRAGAGRRRAGAFELPALGLPRRRRCRPHRRCAGRAQCARHAGICLQPATGAADQKDAGRCRFRQDRAAHHRQSATGRAVRAGDRRQSPAGRSVHFDPSRFGARQSHPHLAVRGPGPAVQRRLSGLCPLHLQRQCRPRRQPAVRQIFGQGAAGTRLAIHAALHARR